MSGVAKWMFWLSSPAPNHKLHLLPSAREFATSGPLSPGQCQIRPTCLHPWRKQSVANSSLPSSTASHQQTSSVPCWPYRAGTEGWDRQPILPCLPVPGLHAYYRVSRAEDPPTRSVRRRRPGCHHHCKGRDCFPVPAPGEGSCCLGHCHLHQNRRAHPESCC